MGTEQKLEWVAQELEAVKRERDEDRRALSLVRTPQEGVWLWEGRGRAELEGLVCPVVMSADTALAIVAGRDTAAADAIASLEAELCPEDVGLRELVMGLRARVQALEAEHRNLRAAVMPFYRQARSAGERAGDERARRHSSELAPPSECFERVSVRESECAALVLAFAKSTALISEEQTREPQP